jgi:hypothetical protein
MTPETVKHVVSQVDKQASPHVLGHINACCRMKMRDEVKGKAICLIDHMKIMVLHASKPFRTAVANQIRRPR